MIIFGIQTSLLLTFSIYIRNWYQNVSRLSTKKMYPTTQLWTVSLIIHTVRTFQTALFPYSSILVGVIKNPREPTKRYASFQTKVTYNRSMSYGNFHQLPVDFGKSHLLHPKLETSLEALHLWRLAAFPRWFPSVFPTWEGMNSLKAANVMIFNTLLKGSPFFRDVLGGLLLVVSFEVVMG